MKDLLLCIKQWLKWNVWRGIEKHIFRRMKLWFLIKCKEFVYKNDINPARIGFKFNYLADEYKILMVEEDIDSLGRDIITVTAVKDE